jgi:lipoprotein-anchoring transpeptidase ErfK/SrfK
MISRRTLLVGLLGAPLGACNSLQTPSLKTAFLGDLRETYARYRPEAQPGVGETPPARPANLAGTVVPYNGEELPGTIVVKTGERRLYLVMEEGSAIRYPVGVGKTGKQWQGVAEVDGAYIRPAWAPTSDIRRDNPNVPDLIPGGAPENPMGERVLTLSGGEYAIHGTNRPESIGTYASYGCIRMFNEDVVDLFGRVQVGTKVVVTA